MYELREIERESERESTTGREIQKHGNPKRRI